MIAAPSPAPAVAPSPSLSPSSSASAAPALSAVIASVNGWGLLNQTLDALDRLPERSRMEVIVVSADPDPNRESVRQGLAMRSMPVRVVQAERRESIPRLRSLGASAARGDLIAILEDHVCVEAGWAESMIESHRRNPSAAAVAGPVENGQNAWLNWAVYFCEYSAYMSPVPEGFADDLPGNNISYKRSALLRHLRVLDEGKWESWINRELQDEGYRLVSTNRAAVRHIKPFRLGYFLKQRLLFSRSYAGMRRADQTWSKRLIYAAGSAILPALLTLRTALAVFAKRRHRARFLACLPAVALFMTVGAVGEMMGYLLGAGDSLERVE